MDVKEYRRRYEAELAASQVAASAAAPTGFAARTIDVPSLLSIVGDPQEPIEVRVAALQAVGARAFLTQQFAQHHPAYLETLRRLTGSETPLQLREKALAILASERDPHVQELLKNGLRNPQQAVVPPPRALQLLGLDDHANVAGLAQEVFDKAQDIDTKEAALRVLVTDAGSQDLLERILKDKAQPRNLRMLSATGLQSLNPQRFAEIAQQIVNDDNDYEDIRATTLGALAGAPEHGHLRSDANFMDRVVQLGAQNALPNLRAAAMRLIRKP
jgi:hypothetical protein